MTQPEYQPDTEPARNGAPRPLPELLSELWDLVRAYLRQEAVDPLRGIGRYVLFGVVGTVLLGTGVILLAVGALRALQGETSAFDDNLSWVPYAIVFVGLVGSAGLAVQAISRSSKNGRNE